MAVGDVLPESFVSCDDPATGAPVERLTSPRELCHGMRYTARQVTRDGRFLIYSRERNGMRRICAMNLETGVSLQLTAGRDVADYTGVLSPDDRFLYYLQGDGVFRINLYSLMRERVYRSPRGWAPQTFTVSDDGRRVVVCESSGRSVPSFLGRSDWEAFSLSGLAQPRSRVVRTGVATGETNVVVEQEAWIGLAQERPGDPDTLLFCHEGSYEDIDARVWLVDSDGGRLRQGHPQPAGCVVSHEFWWPDGSLFGCYVSGVGDTPGAEIRGVDPETGRVEVSVAVPPLVHCSLSRDGRTAVGDSRGSAVPVHEGAQEGPGGDDLLYLIDMATGVCEPLCSHGSSWSLSYRTTQDCHPHPFVSDDGRWVFFTSDRDGKPAMFRVPVPGASPSSQAGLSAPLDDSERDPEWGLWATERTGASRWKWISS